MPPHLCRLNSAKFMPLLSRCHICAQSHSRSSSHAAAFMPLITVDSQSSIGAATCTLQHLGRHIHAARSSIYGAVMEQHSHCSPSAAALTMLHFSQLSRHSIYAEPLKPPHLCLASHAAAFPSQHSSCSSQAHAAAFFHIYAATRALPLFRRQIYAALACHHICAFSLTPPLLKVDEDYPEHICQR